MVALTDELLRAIQEELAARRSQIDGDANVQAVSLLARVDRGRVREVMFRLDSGRSYRRVHVPPPPGPTIVQTPSGTGG